MHPIYVIVYEQLYGSAPLNMYGLPRAILAVIACDITNIDEVYQTRVLPLQNAGRHIQVLYLSREPDSFLRETAEQLSVE